MPKFSVRAVAVAYHDNEVIFHCPPVINKCQLRRFATKCTSLRNRIQIEVGGWYQMEIEYAVKNQKTIGILSSEPCGELMDTRVVFSIAELKTTLDLTSHIAAGFWHAKSNELVLVADFDHVIPRTGCRPRPNDKLRAWCAPLLDKVSMNNTTQAQWKVTELVPKEEEEGRPGYGLRAEGEAVTRVRFENVDPPVEEDPVHEDPFRRDARDAVVPPMHSQSFWDKSAPRNCQSMQRRKPVMPAVFATRHRAANGGPLHPRDLGISPAAQAADTRLAPALNSTSATSATAAQDDDDWDLQPEGAQPRHSAAVLSHFGRSVQSQEAPQHAAQRADDSRSPQRNTQRTALPQRSSRITAGLSWQQHLGVAVETPVVEGESIHFGDDDAPRQDAAQQHTETEWSAALVDLLSFEEPRSVGDDAAPSENEPISPSIEEKGTAASSELIVDTSDPSALTPVVSPAPKEQRWKPVQRTGCVGVIWTKRSYQYLVYSPDLEGREAFIQIFVHTRNLNVGQWLQFDATLWKPEARYTIGRYTPIDEVIHAMPIVDSVIITCDVHLTNNNGEEPPLVVSEFFGRVEDPHSLAAGLRPGIYSVNLMYSNEQKGSTTGRWSLGFVNSAGF